MTTGIYLIKVLRPDALPLYYVGQSLDCNYRLKQHKKLLNAKRHFNLHFQRAASLYGIDSIWFEVLEVCQEAELNVREQWWLTEMVGHPRVMNIARDAMAPNRGRKASDEVKKKMSLARMGDKNHNFGRNFSSEHRRNIGLARAGEKHPQFGKKASAEHRAKIGDAHRGEKSVNFGRVGAKHPRSKPVQATHKVTGVVLKFESTGLAHKAGYQQSAVSRACNGKLPHYKGYVWQFTKNEVE